MSTAAPISTLPSRSWGRDAKRRRPGILRMLMAAARLAESARRGDPLQEADLRRIGVRPVRTTG